MTTREEFAMADSAAQVNRTNRGKKTNVYLSGALTSLSFSHVYHENLWIPPWNPSTIRGPSVLPLFQAVEKLTKIL
jgi:hypothetical protein